LRARRVRYHPESQHQFAIRSLEEIPDWNVSRQLWWGHQIPIWYCDDCGDVFASVEEHVASCPSCGGSVHQDPDVLDTWFSSGLWPFSTLGWPDQTEDLRRFYPGDVLETGYEIIFTWVARMIFFGIEMMGEVPFHTVYLHGIVRDEAGAKMSKTKGNVIDPLDVSHEYGADALRYTLVTQASPGNDSRLSLQKVEASRNFGNKLWNMTRFALRSFDPEQIEVDASGPKRPSGDLDIIDRWIVSRLDAVIEGATGLMERHLYGEAGRQIADFLWGEGADWYIEAAKVRLREGGDAAKTVGQVIAYVLERSLRLLHPYMPFITEALWQQLPHAGESIMVAPWPAAGPRDEDAEAQVGAMMELVRGMRNARTEAGVEPAKWISSAIYAGDHLDAFEQMRGEIAFLARIDSDHLELREGKPGETGNAITVVAGDIVAILPLEDMVDLGAERERLAKELEEARQEQARAEKQLSNESFISRAPDHVVQVQRDRLERANEQVAIIEQRLSALDG
jgi:valyl-tRNA synthetase